MHDEAAQILIYWTRSVCILLYNLSVLSFIFRRASVSAQRERTATLGSHSSSALERISGYCSAL